MIANATLNEINRKIIQLFPQRRTKRGIIDGLGSIVKIITGNLDAKDGEKYEKAILELQKNQNNQYKVMIKQISLTCQIADKISTSIATLKTNKLTLEHHIKRIEVVIKNIVLNQVHAIDLINLHYTFTQIISIANLILHILNTLESRKSNCICKTFNIISFYHKTTRFRKFKST